MIRPGDGEVLVRVRAAGLCHSDLSTINGDRPRQLPMVLGHEAAGEVVEVGPGVRELAVGDHVIFVFMPSCGHCDPCAEGRPALCEGGCKVQQRRDPALGRHPPEARRQAGLPSRRRLSVRGILGRVGKLAREDRPDDALRGSGAVRMRGRHRGRGCHQHGEGACRQLRGRRRAWRGSVWYR